MGICEMTYDTHTHAYISQPNRQLPRQCGARSGSPQLPRHARDELLAEWPAFGELRRPTPDALSNHGTATAQNDDYRFKFEHEQQRIKSGKKQKSMGTIIRKWRSSAKEKAEMEE